MPAVNFTAQRGLSLLGDELGVWMDDTDGTTDQTDNSNDLTAVGSITKSAVATSADLQGYSGWSGSIYRHRAYDADFDFGTSGWSMYGWIKQAANSAVERILFRAYYTGAAWSGSGIGLETQVDGTIRGKITNDGWTSEDNITSGATIDDDEWHHIALVSDGTYLYLYIDGAQAVARVTITNAAASLSNANATLRFGVGQDGTLPLTNGTLTQWRIVDTNRSDAQIQNIYDKEKHLYSKYSYYTVEGTEYSLDMGAQSADENINTQKTDNTAIGGAVETLVDRDDIEWPISTGHIHRTDSTYLRVSEVREFLYATRGSETFEIDLYGTVATPDEVKEVIRIGNAALIKREGYQDWFRTSFRVREQ